MSRLKRKTRAKSNKKNKNKQRNNFFLRKKELREEILKYDDPILAAKCEEVVEEK